MSVSFEIYFVIFICYYYYHYVIASWRWFLIISYIINHINLYLLIVRYTKFFGLSSLVFFLESLYASYTFTVFLVYFWFLLLYFFLVLVFFFACFVIYVYVFSTCSGLIEKRIRFTYFLVLVLYLYFTIWCFCIVLTCESL